MNFLKSGLRFSRSKKLYSIINLIGLGITSCFCIMVYWHISHELSYDNFHNNQNSLYRFELKDIFRPDRKPAAKSLLSFVYKNAEEKNLVSTPVILAAELQRNFPEIENTVRIAKAQVIVRVNQQSFKEDENKVVFTDASFFKMFNFPLKKGDPLSAFSSADKVVISEKMAVKYFGNQNAIGQTIQLSNLSNSLFTVSAVLKDFPENSSFQFDMLLPREADAWYQDNVEHGLNSFSDLLILQIKKNTDITALNKKLDEFGKHYFQPTIKHWSEFPGNSVKTEDFHAVLRPFADAHYNMSEGWYHYTSLQNIYQLGGIAVLILLIACMNYILLTLANTASRSQEVGIRKTIGAGRKQIILQFYLETQLQAFVSVLIGFILAIAFFPFFNRLTGSSSLHAPLSFTNTVWPILIFSISLGIIAGIYPALVMSGIRPLNMMRGFSTYRLNPKLSRLLVTMQFSVCIILIIVSLVISRQMRFMNEKDLGFDKSQILTIQSPYGFEDHKNGLQLKEKLYRYAITEPGIENITSTYSPYKGFKTNNHTIANLRVEVQDFNVDYNYFSFFRIPIIKGRSFSSQISSDSVELQLSAEQKSETGSAARQAVVINETLYKMLGQPPLEIINRELGAKIIGVCRDYYSDDLTKKIAPAYHRIAKSYIGYFWIKLKSGQNIPVTLAKIEQHWKQITGSLPFSFTFLDEDVARSYEAYQRWMKTITASCLLAIIIACLGLFGLSGIATANRVREIGIRKVLGATVADLFLSLNKGMFIMAFTSFIIAIPVAIYLSNQWLENFAYRIQPDWPILAIAGIISLATAFVAVSYHTIKTARTNPVKSLRAE